jgi:hypothetical protein
MARLLLGKKKVLEEMDMRYIAETTMTTTVAEPGNIYLVITDKSSR